MYQPQNVQATPSPPPPTVRLSALNLLHSVLDSAVAQRLSALEGTARARERATDRRSKTSTRAGSGGSKNRAASPVASPFTADSPYPRVPLILETTVTEGWQGRDGGTTATSTADSPNALETPRRRNTRVRIDTTKHAAKKLGRAVHPAATVVASTAAVVAPENGSLSATKTSSHGGNTATICAQPQREKKGRTMRKKPAAVAGRPTARRLFPRAGGGQQHRGGLLFPDHLSDLMADGTEEHFVFPDGGHGGGSESGSRDVGDRRWLATSPSIASPRLFRDSSSTHTAELARKERAWSRCAKIYILRGNGV